MVKETRSSFLEIMLSGCPVDSSRYYMRREFRCEVYYLPVGFIEEVWIEIR